MEKTGLVMGSRALRAKRQEDHNAHVVAWRWAQHDQHVWDREDALAMGEEKWAEWVRDFGHA